MLLSGNLGTIRMTSQISQIVDKFEVLCAIWFEPAEDFNSQLRCACSEITWSDPLIVGGPPLDAPFQAAHNWATPLLTVQSRRYTFVAGAVEGFHLYVHFGSERSKMCCAVRSNHQILLEGLRGDFSCSTRTPYTMSLYERGIIPKIWNLKFRWRMESWNSRWKFMFLEIFSPAFFV